MSSDIGKLKKKIKFYFQNNTKIQLTSRELKLKGQILSLPTLFKPYFDFKLEDDNLMQVYLEDIYPDSIYPLSKSVEIIEENKSNTRRPIPISLKKDLWKDFFGFQFQGRCHVCKREIFRDKFEAGHKHSVFNGGSDSIDNLVPLCFDCNRSMGSQNLSEFKSQFYS